MKKQCDICLGNGWYEDIETLRKLQCKACYGRGRIDDLSAMHATFEPTGTESRVCADIAARQAKGIAKYGTTVQDNPLPLREWLEHAYQEALDQAIYLKRAMEELDKGPFKPFFDAAEKTDAYKQERQALRDAR